MIALFESVAWGYLAISVARGLLETSEKTNANDILENDADDLSDDQEQRVAELLFCGSRIACPL